MATKTVTRARQKAGGSWLERRSPEYRANVARWEYTLDHYTADVLDPDKVQQYLVKRSSGESAKAFKERAALADYTNHFATAIDALVGMLGRVEENANRVWKRDDSDDPGLGDPSDRRTPIGRLWHAADPDGNGWLTVWKTAATDLCLFRLIWVAVDGPPDGTVIRILPPFAVPNWITVGGRETEVLVEEEVDTRQALDEAEEKGVVRQFVRYTTAGWQRYRLGENGDPVALGDAAAGDFGTYHYEDQARERVLPIFPVRLPIRRDVGWYLANKANRIFNRESQRDHLLGIGCAPRLVLGGTETSFDKKVNALERGSNVIHEEKEADGSSRYIAPEMSPATEQREVLRRKVEEFYETAFQSYGDAAREVTATEIRQDVAAGVGAFLELLRGALDSAENKLLPLIEQKEFPTDRKKWFVARVERSSDFMPSDPEKVIDALKKRAFGDDTRPLPIGLEGLVEATRQIVDYQGISVNDDQIRAAVKARLAADAITAYPDLPFPAELRVAVLMDVLAASGHLDPEEVVKLADGTEVKRLELLRQQAALMAEAQDVARRREAETFPSDSFRRRDPEEKDEDGPDDRDPEERRPPVQEE